MSIALYDKGGLRFWNEDEIIRREYFIRAIEGAIRCGLLKLNSSWTFHRVDAPCLVPSATISDSYDDTDVFICTGDLSLRPETTNGSYLYARHLNSNGYKYPMCVWQAGKSYRRETNDGASASKLRFNEFYQLEFQCIYSKTSKADYRTILMLDLINLLNNIGFKGVNIVDSDRLPSYSLETKDIEAIYIRNRIEEHKEIASISKRTDFSNEHEVLEIAFGLDRLIEIAGQR